MGTIIEPQEHLLLTVEHLRYQRSILSGLLEETGEATDDSLGEYISKIDDLYRLIRSFDRVIEYYTSV